MEFEFGIINRADSPIQLDEWSGLIEAHSNLEQMEDREGKNPFTNESVIFSGLGKAYYVENGKKIGSASLENGVILTTGAPKSFGESIAVALGGTLHEDDGT